MAAVSVKRSVDNNIARQSIMCICISWWNYRPLLGRHIDRQLVESWSTLHWHVGRHLLTCGSHYRSPLGWYLGRWPANTSIITSQSTVGGISVDYRLSHISANSIGRESVNTLADTLLLFGQQIGWYVGWYVNMIGYEMSVDMSIWRDMSINISLVRINWLF